MGRPRRRRWRRRRRRWRRRQRRRRRRRQRRRRRRRRQRSRRRRGRSGRHRRRLPLRAQVCMWLLALDAPILILDWLITKRSAYSGVGTKGWNQGTRRTRGDSGMYTHTHMHACTDNTHMHVLHTRARARIHSSSMIRSCEDRRSPKTNEETKSIRIETHSSNMIRSCEDRRSLPPPKKKQQRHVWDVGVRSTVGGVHCTVRRGWGVWRLT